MKKERETITAKEYDVVINTESLPRWKPQIIIQEDDTSIYLSELRALLINIWKNAHLNYDDNKKEYTVSYELIEKIPNVIGD